MRAALALLVLLAGAATTGTALGRSSSARIRPASGWSLSERLAALRIERALPPSLRKQASLSLREGRAFLKVYEPGGPVLLKCAAGVDLAAALQRYAAGGATPGCQTQAVDEVGDVLVYEVSGRVPPLCPGEYATLTEEQLHHALFLPALQLDPGADAALQRGRLAQCSGAEANCSLFRAAGSALYCGVVRSCAEGACFQGAAREIRPDDVATSLYYAQALAQARSPAQVAPAICGPVPMSAHLSTLVSEAVTATTVGRFADAQPWSAASLPATASAETAAELHLFFLRHPRGICFFVRGVDLDRPRDAEAVAQGLAFPVFAPADPRAAGRATPLLRALQKAAGDDESLAALLARCDLSAERACRAKRERIAAQLRAALGGLGPALTNLADDELPYHLGSSGPFHLADTDSLHLTLESTAEVPKAKGPRTRLQIRYQPLWPELLPERELACQQRPGICLFRSLWSAGVATPGEPAEDGFESLVGLFARREANTRCVRRLFNALARADPGRLVELQRELHEPVGARSSGAPCDPRARGPLGLVPRESPGECEGPGEQPFGETGSESCRPISLVFVQEEPWAAAAARIAAIAAAAHVEVAVSGVKSSEVHRGALGSWDVLLTVASNYYNHRFPTLVPLLHPAGSQNLSGGRATSEPGQQLLAAYESSVLYPPPARPGRSGGAEAGPELAPATRAESLARLEEDVARTGPAPIYPLAFLRPATAILPRAQAEAALSPWYFARLLQGWSAQP